MDPGARFRLGGPPEREYECTATDLGGGIFEETFTDSFGNSNIFRYQLPNDMTLPLGVYGYFHGNVPIDNVFDPPAEAALLDGYFSFAGMSEGIADPETRGWETRDHNWLFELLKSNFNGCAPDLDLDRVILRGESQGACFLNDFLQSYWQEFSGGILAECGCFGTLPMPGNTDLAEWRSRWKVYVQNSTNDFLYEYGIRNYEFYKHGLGLNVVGDLEATGDHCSGGLVNLGEVLDWMVNDTPLADPVPPVAQHWEPVVSPLSFLTDYTSLAARGERVVRLIQRADVAPEQEHLLLREWIRVNWSEDERAALDAWLETEFGKKFVLYESNDYGETWTELATDLPEPNERIAIDASGVVLIATSTGLLGVSTDGTVSTVAFDGESVSRVRIDDSGRVIANTATALWRRDLAGVWTEMGFVANPLDSYGDAFVYQNFEGYQLSTDGGVSSTIMNTPEELSTVIPFGTTVYAVDFVNRTIAQSVDSGATFGAPTSVTAMSAFYVASNGDILHSQNQFGGKRSTDGGATWTAEPAFGGAYGDIMGHLSGGRMMTGSTNGLLRLVE